MNKYLISLTVCIFFVSSCASVEVTTNNVENEKESPFEIDENQKFLDFLEADWEKTLTNNPLFATYTGDKRLNDKINPNTIDQFEKYRLSDLESLKKLNSIDYDKLNPDNKLNYNLKKFDIESDLNLSQFPIYYLRLNQRGGIQSFYETGNRLVYQSKKDYYDWLNRLNQFSENILNFLEINKQGLQNGYTQPKLVTQGVISQIDAIINSDINSNPYLKVFIDADESLLSQNEKLELINDAKELIINKINPAYIKLNNFLKNDYLVNSRDTIGIKDIPDGKKYYEQLAKHYTTTDLTPDEIHDIGLREIQRIRAEMDEIIDSVNWDGDFESFLNYLRTSPRFYYDNPDDLFDAYLIMSKTIDPLLPKLFNVFPRAPYGVIPIPAESAPFTTTAYYNSPSPGRPGYFYANLYKPDSRPKYEIPVLTVHEAVPGHHFQISLAQELENVPTFRKYQGITAFVEGWGLYSEELGEYINLYDDPYDKFGQLTYDMWRAIRLVVDTGMHYKDWTRDDAINLFIENSAKSILDIENEVDRYIAWPGQALAYKIGQLKILELRSKAEKELGEKYDIKDFHDEVLKRGSLPLDLLEYYIDEWINQTLNS
jgi:prolyl oligopeptidase